MDTEVPKARKAGKNCIKVTELLGFKWLQECQMYSIDTDGAQIRLCFMEQDIMRVRVSFDRQFEEESYNLAMTCWSDRLDSVLGPFRTRKPAIKVVVEEEEQFIRIKTNKMKIILVRKPYRMKVLNDKNEIIHMDGGDRTYKRDRLGRVYHYTELKSQFDCFYGFGQNTGPLNKVDCFIKQCPQDSLNYNPSNTLSLYKHIPFYIKLKKNLKHAVGLYYHNSYESCFDMGNDRIGYYERYCFFCADGGDIDYFVINGPKVSDVVRRYTDLTGKPAFHPMSSLGYLGSTMIYAQFPRDCDRYILNFIDTAKAEGVPISNFQLSSGYANHPETGKKHMFIWNNLKFPNVPSFFQKMKQRGVTVSPNVKPIVFSTHPDFKEFEEGNCFIEKSDETGQYITPWWGGETGFVDFTNPTGRQVWKKHLKMGYLKHGTVSIWNDNNQYEALDDRQSLCNFQNKKTILDRLRSVQALMMAHATLQAAKEEHPNLRPHVISRSGCAGMQRYASSWSGDNSTTWKTLYYNLSTLLNASLSGLANYGCDTGGFYGPAPTEELFVRWVQNGIFHPRFSIHSCNTDNTITQPWMYSNSKHLIIEALNFRYSLLPYLYSLLYQSSLQGIPIVRPLLYEFQHDENCYDIFDTFMLGNSLLVATVLEKGAKTRKIYFPKGSNWYSWWSRDIYEGGTIAQVPVDLASIPIFLRGNAIIPTAQNFSNKNKMLFKKLSIKAAFQSESEFTIFEDDGESENYKKGDKLETTIRVKPIHEQSICKVEIDKKGEYKSSIEEMEWSIKVYTSSPIEVYLNKVELKRILNRSQWQSSTSSWYFSHTTGSVLIRYPNMKEYHELFINCGAMISFAKRNKTFV